MVKSINGKTLAALITSASNNLVNNKKDVDTLNVFPVPDGDTGTNMSLTVSFAASEAKKHENESVGVVSKALSSASLRGARGNSGVITSQLCRGFAKYLDGKQEANSTELAKALENGVKTAYSAVMRPTEGTILTVAREAAAAAVKKSAKEEDIISVFEYTLQKAKEALDNTPNQLPVLKEAGVVDAGGAGLYKLLEGAYLCITGSAVELLDSADAPADKAQAQNAQASLNPDDIKFAYCTEFIIEKKSPDVNVAAFSSVIDDKGDCKLVIDDDEIVKVHIHTNHPGFVIEEALKLGMLNKLKIDNMKIQHTNIIAENAPTGEETKEEAKPTPHKPYGFIAIAAGKGLADLFREYGADEIIEGGQTMNPSTDDILKAAENLNCDCIYVLPNNKNIILAAEQAAELSETKMIVIPTKSIPQGYSAMMAFLPQKTADENTSAMNEAISLVSTGQVTYAVRNTSVNGKEIKEGDIIGISGGEISVVSDSPEDVLRELVSSMVDDDASVISVYFGEDVSEETAESISEELEEIYPDLDVIFHSGSQPLYYYIVSVE